MASARALAPVLGAHDRVTLRDDMDMVPGQLAAQRRLSRNENRLLVAWADLEVFPADVARDYLQRPLGAIDQQANEKLMAIILGFAMVAVEADRERRRDEQSHQADRRDLRRG